MVGDIVEKANRGEKMELQKVKKTAAGILLFFTLSGLCGCGSRSEEPVLLEQHQQQNQQEIEEAEEEQDEEKNEEQVPAESEIMPEEPGNQEKILVTRISEEALSSLKCYLTYEADEDAYREKVCFQPLEDLD